CDIDMMRDLSVLADTLSGEDISVETTKAILPGIKDSGLITVISIATLGLSAISTLISVLSYWNSTRPKYKISVKSGENFYELTNLNKSEIRTMINGVKENATNSALLEILKR
ncbi:MAG: hypothetical protein KAS07_05900, partial [Candidatus Pacebacteria bacterium]|nr:hypothetical protein [Candidatus Paceibacterota bacterium]